MTMRRIKFFVLVTLMLGALVPGFSVLDIKNSGSLSAAAPQTPTPTLRRIAVDRQTIAVLPRDKKYVIDLTQRGVVYRFQAGSRIDFSRVTVRTARGEVAIGAFLKKMIPPSKLATFKYTSQSFSLGTRPTGTLTNLPSGPSQILVCGKVSCVCSGHDCFDMVFGGTFGGKEYCTGTILCSEDESGTMWCSCYKA
jgi:hypothetical protein